jgi:hypothetical protein
MELSASGQAITVTIIIAIGAMDIAAAIDGLTGSGVS